MPSFPSQAAVAILGNRLVKVAGHNSVTPCTAITDVPVGSLVVDAAAGAGTRVKALPGEVHEILASAPVTAGDIVEPSTTPGYVQPITSGTRVGIALTTAAGTPLRCQVLGGA